MLAKHVRAGGRVRVEHGTVCRRAEWPFHPLPFYTIKLRGYLGPLESLWAPWSVFLEVGINPTLGLVTYYQSNM